MTPGEVTQVGPALARALEALGARARMEALAGDEPEVTLEFSSGLAQAEARGSEARFRSLVEAIPEAVFIVGASGLLYGNPAAVSLFGYPSLEEALGKDPRSVAHPDDVPQLEQRAVAMLLEKRTLPPFEYRVFRRDGALLTIEVSSMPVEYEGAPAILTFARDATERKRVEAELLQADRLTVLGLLAGGLAHAMNNPLSYVLLGLEQAERGLARVDEVEAREKVLARLREAHQGAQRIAEVVRRMRSLSRMDDDKRGAVDVRGVLEAALELFGSEIRHRGELVTRLGDAPPVLASRGRLEQVFLNLLAHAAQSLPEEGGGRVEISLFSDENSVMVEMLDSVRPAHPGELSRALEPFATPREGTLRALSLPLCRSVVEGLGGEISVDGSVRGTHVRIRLPAATALASVVPPSASEPASAPLGTAPARLLVVDDDVAVGSALRLMLEPEHSITCVRDVQEALDMLLSGDDYDLILCDLVMPEPGAALLLDTLARERPDLVAQVVLMTGGAYTESARDLLTRVDAPRIDKPFDLARLRALLARALGQREP